MPGYANPQNLNRFSYVRNNPLRYTDPTGHRIDEGCGSPICNPPPPAGGGGGDGDVDDRRPPRGNGGGNSDTNDNGVPDVPDPGWVIPLSGGPCQYTDLTECLYSGGAWPSGDFTITNDEWNQLTLALYYDIYRRSHEGDGFWTLEYDPTGRSQQIGVLFVPYHTAEYYHREDYDTPFWDHYERYEGTICFETGECFGRNDVNYVAQGMWSAAAHEGPILAVAAANVWNWTRYNPPHLASVDENYWAARGAAIYEQYVNSGYP